MKPFVLITTPNTVAPSNYNEFVGKPDFKSGSISTMKQRQPDMNYVKISAIKNIGSSEKIPETCMNDIINLLKAGVYIDEER